ncbi:xanthine phosphoribosyltransferase [Paenibacillus aceris]|uniref:Xanthine phosphoribosyltransferase n=1 Tax=Paenibacillus aceris TaxID=869555 RepID=A0ABS4I3B4_9BACL|nr:xanthine phosphoribosyltransferase [Paenibacillus aceris]MBP1965295.1 xanthine phosphoribosyltransferase [Paenibacillus aceris]NHW35978.1 xanthine phosphoribosyltransferase [Paenibacillus aceris]
MELLKQRIQEVGVVVSDKVLKLDAILNHQVDPVLTMEMGREFARLFRETKPDKVLTVESSGIPIAFTTALHLEIPMIFARRKKTLTMDQDTYSERVPSFTKGIVTDIMVSSHLLHKGERVLLIDDFIANGDAARGLIRIIEKAEAELVGVGIAVEKSFQSGGSSIRDRGIRVESLARISSLANGQITFD